MDIAADLDLSTSMITNERAEVAGSGIGNPLDRIEELLKSTGDQGSCNGVASAAGGFFIQNPKHYTASASTDSATNQFVQEFADLLHVIATATANEKISPAAKELRRAGKN